ncbi:MAG: UDP-glucose 4-epimerase, partial [Gammaproteobacteria bacterium]|nr:UDP-glucose 4-epimerase [Gammaproteobacteria bacterium]
MTHYLVTGASGVVGSAIVPPLLAYPDVTLQVLMRPKTGQDLAARLDELKAFWLAHYPQLDAADLNARVHAVSGEITAPALGLSTHDQQDLTQHCTHIIHCAASVKMNLPLEEARQTALFPVASVIALAQRCTQ